MSQALSLGIDHKIVAPLMVALPDALVGQKEIWVQAKNYHKLAAWLQPPGILYGLFAFSIFGDMMILGIDRL